MFKTLKNAWSIPDLRKRLIFTVFIMILFRIGTNMLIPFLDPQAVSAHMNGGQSALQTINAVTGGNLGRTTIFALGVQPYITASIVIQLLTIAIPALERLSKEGEEGRKRLKTIERYTTLALSFMMSIGYYLFMKNSRLIGSYTGAHGVLVSASIIAILMAGTSLCVWIGEEVNQKGIGNGISMIIFAGIVSNLPSMGMQLKQYFYDFGLKAGNLKFMIGAPIMLVLYIVMVVFVIYITNAERRITINYAKRVVGKKMYGGQSTYIPFKVNMSGVLPVIFASTFLSIPQLIIMFAQVKSGTILYNVLNFFNDQNILYGIIYFVLVFAFNFFYTTIQQNPVQISNDLRKNNGAIPGIRPGKPTADFLQKVVSKVTVLGGLFLSVVATVPIFFGILTGMNFALAGTSIIIIVGVALETVKAIESKMMTRHYKGFLE